MRIAESIGLEEADLEWRLAGRCLRSLDGPEDPDLRIQGLCLRDPEFRELYLRDPYLGKSILKRVAKKVKKAGRPVMKAVRKKFVKVAPVLAAASQLLNLVVPGLGVAVGVAISAGAAAMKIRQERKEEARLKKLSKEEEAAAAAEVAAAEKEAHESLDAAYAQGEGYFTERYGMSREKWSALSVEEKTRFLNGAVYDANRERLQAAGIARDQFTALSKEEQERILREAGVGEGFPEWGYYCLLAGGAIAIILAVYLATRD